MLGAPLIHMEQQSKKQWTLKNAPGQGTDAVMIWLEAFSAPHVQE